MEKALCAISRWTAFRKGCLASLYHAHDILLTSSLGSQHKQPQPSLCQAAADTPTGQSQGSQTTAPGNIPRGPKAPPSPWVKGRKTHLSNDKSTGSQTWLEPREAGNEPALGTGGCGFQETLRLPEEQTASPVSQRQGGRRSLTSQERRVMNPQPSLGQRWHPSPAG